MQVLKNMAVKYWLPIEKVNADVHVTTLKCCPQNFRESRSQNKSF